MNIDNDVLKKLKELEEERRLRVIVDYELSDTRGFVIENCDQYAIIVKDGLSDAALKDVLTHEGIHICSDHLEGHSRSEAESKTKSIMTKSV